MPDFFAFFKTFAIASSPFWNVSGVIKATAGAYLYSNLG